MEQTALQQETALEQLQPETASKPGGGRKTGAGRRPHAARRRGRRLVSLFFGLLFGTVLVLSGVGLGTVSAAVIGMTKLAELQRQAEVQAPGEPDQQQRAQQKPPATRQPGGAKPSAGASTGTSPGVAAGGGSSASAASEGETTAERVPAAGARSALGVEAVDAPKGAGALLVGVHVPGPGHAAGLVRGDVLTAFGGSRIASAADLASAVATAPPGRAVTLTVRRANGDRQMLPVTPGVVT
jgi:membrane-associated protease RseP (regulator of RpoE activity)